MSLFDRPELTLEQKAEQIQKIIESKAHSSREQIKRDIKEAFDIFWNPPSPLTTQDICDSFGVRAWTPFDANSKTIQFIISIDPSYIPPTPGLFLPNQDGTVLIAPHIVTQPDDVVVEEGQNIVLSVTIKSKGTISYQWKKDGEIINDANLSSLTIENALVSNSGDYIVEITNEAGKTTSRVVSVTVNSLGE